MYKYYLRPANCGLRILLRAKNSFEGDQCTPVGAGLAKGNNGVKVFELYFLYADP